MDKKTGSIYLTVRLDIEYNQDGDWEIVKNDVISECKYNFDYDNGDIQGDNELEIEIVNTEICGENEIYNG